MTPNTFIKLTWLIRSHSRQKNIQVLLRGNQLSLKPRTVCPSLCQTMWKVTVLVVCLLVVGVQPMDDLSYGVKLCGREFIRAVIFTCGGSRWRRSLRGSADPFEEPFTSLQDFSDRLSRSSVVENLLHGTRGDPVGPFQRPARSFITEEILEALRKADRKGRDVVVGLSNACCKWGCSKSEISSLC
ncbi:relaxin-3a isoform X1 [Xyrichtys novacula]|uniref:Insulin n=1 Tax=Xyrichtys novacula TaxID=13765 RepID=A0AAV1GTM9_XYRNO|nr:relaxin-3a isoform X1 [Xyrichtys novacula]